MHKIFFVAGLVLAVAMCGCSGGTAYTAVIPPSGLIYSNVKAPLTTEYENSPVSEMEGRAMTQRVYIPIYLPISIAWGDAGMANAAGRGGLSSFNGADYSYFNILGVYQEFTVIPNGQ